MKSALTKLIIAFIIGGCCSLCFCVPLANSNITTLLSESIDATSSAITNLNDDTTLDDSSANSAEDCIIPVYTFYQTDAQWADYLYGGYDPISTHGCGPTTLATAVCSLTGQLITPIDVAKWSANNGCYSKGYGSYHTLIPNGASYYGLTCESCDDISQESFQTYLSEGKLLILLMGPGDFSTSGHFILVHGYTADGEFYVSDCFSEENTAQTWSADSLISQLSTSASAGGPVWVISN